MANLPLPAPFTEHVRFSLERAHCHLSSHLQTSQCNTVPVWVPTCVFIQSASQSRRVCQAWGSSLFAFDLKPRSWWASRHRLRRRAGYGLPHHQKDSVNSGLCLQGPLLSASGTQELWPVNSTFNNNKLTTGRRVDGLPFSPWKGSNWGQKVDGKVCQRNVIISGITQKVTPCALAYFKHILCQPRSHNV